MRSIFFLLLFLACAIVKSQSLLDSALQEPSAYVLKYKKTSISFTSIDTNYNELTIYGCNVNNHKYYKIIDTAIIRYFIKDSSGLYIFETPYNQLFIDNNPDTNLFTRYSSAFLGTYYIQYELMEKYQYTVDSTNLPGYYLLKFDSTNVITQNAPDIKTYVTLHFYYNRVNRIIDKMEFKVWFSGFYQYEKDSLISFNRNFPHAYDSIKVDNLLPYLKKTDTTALSWYDILKAKLDSAIGTKFPDIKLPTFEGTRHRVFDKKAQVYIIDFHYKACFPCWQFHDELNRLHEKYDTPAIKIIGINHLDKNNAVTRDFYQKKKSGYPIVYSDNQLKEKYPINSYPMLLILNNKMEIVEVIEGYSEKNVGIVEKYIRKALGYK